MASDEDENKIKREGVCAASLPTTMGIIAGFLSQTVLKHLLSFGEVSPFLGYNAFTDFFPKYPLAPNPDCSDAKCRELQKYYTENPDAKRLKDKVKENGAEEVKEIVHEDNDWGITLEEGQLEESQESSRP